VGERKGTRVGTGSNWRWKCYVSVKRMRNCEDDGGSSRRFRPNIRPKEGGAKGKKHTLRSGSLESHRGLRKTLKSTKKKNEKTAEKEIG